MRRILVLGDDRLGMEQLTQILAKEGHSIQAASDLEATLHRIKAWKPQILLIHAEQTEVPLSQMIAKVRATHGDDYISILLISPLEAADQSAAWDHGADDYITKPYKGHELLTRVRTMLRFKDTQDLLRRANHRIEEISSTDDLTGLLNMKNLHRRGEEEIIRSKQFKKPVSALLINVDRFAELNHRAGFQGGSTALQEIGKRIKDCLRSIDRVARVGADEFFVLLVETDLANAEYMAERIRDAIQSELIQGEKVTACVGIAGYSGEDTSVLPQMSDLFHFTSEALRSAKRSGPNRIEIYSFA